MLEIVEQVELDEINNDSNLTTTEKESVIKARVGQGAFREELIDYWSGCCITRCKLLCILKASHIKPWRDCSNHERLDKFNGLLLSPNIDALFDRGLISFENDGEMLESPLLDKEIIKLLINEKQSKIKFTKHHIKYLEYHRNYIYQHGNI